MPDDEGRWRWSARATRRRNQDNFARAEDFRRRYAVRQRECYETRERHVLCAAFEARDLDNVQSRSLRSVGLSQLVSHA
jgi:hypothetical protein